MVNRGFRYWYNFDNCRKAASECKSRSDFHAKYRAAYRVAKNNGWLDILTNEFWTPSFIYGQCEAEAKKFDNMRDFYVNARAYYEFSKSKGWLISLASFMPDTEAYWTYEKYKEEAKKYKSRTEFATDSPIAYSAARHDKKLDDVCSHMDVLRRKTLTKEECRAIAKKYNTISELQRGDMAVNNAIWRNGWRKELCSHMKGPLEEWTEERLTEEAKKYKHKIDFLNGNQSAYTVAAKKGILDKICSHMEPLGDLYKRAIYAFEFPDNYVYVGLTSNIERRIQQHLNSNSYSAVREHLEMTGLIPKFVLKMNYIEAKEASKMEGRVLKLYIANGWKKLNRDKTGGLGGHKAMFTPEKIRDLAKECSSRKDFMERFSNVYSACSKKKLMYILDEVYKDHIIGTDGKRHKASRIWSEDNIMRAAKSVSSFHEFRLKYKGACERARILGILSKIKSLFSK